MSEVIIFLSYLIAATAFGLSRLPKYVKWARPMFLTASALVAIGISVHSTSLYNAVLIADGFNLSLANTVSMISLELALIGLIAATNTALRGISAGLLLLGAITVLATGFGNPPAEMTALSWQVRMHVLVSLMSYGLLTVGAIVSIYALIQDRRLQARQLSTVNSLFAPLETTEQLLFGITAAGFAGLALAIFSGLAFVDDLFAQHLAHKTVFSILALAVFGTLLAGRFFAGWRGTTAVRLYFGGFLLLCIGYFGTRVILEQVLNRSWS